MTTNLKKTTESTTSPDSAADELSRTKLDNSRAHERLSYVLFGSGLVLSLESGARGYGLLPRKEKDSRMGRVFGLLFNLREHEYIHWTGWPRFFRGSIMGLGRRVLDHFLHHLLAGTRASNAQSNDRP